MKRKSGTAGIFVEILHLSHQGLNGTVPWDTKVTYAEL